MGRGAAGSGIAGPGVAGRVVGVVRGLERGFVPLFGNDPRPFALCLPVHQTHGAVPALFRSAFSEAIDLMSRAMRVGHSVISVLEMVGTEVAEPVGSEFRMVYEEQSLGLPLREAMINLTHRVPIPDIRFLAAAIMLQRETGGNLGEILDKLSLAVRERLRLKRQVVAATAQGRLTARILSILPLAVILMINVISPAYLHVMTNQRVGRAMLLAAVVSQIVGYLWMKKITNVEF